MINGPISPNFIASARIFSRMAALRTSPFSAEVTCRLIADSSLEILLVRPFSRYSVWEQEGSHDLRYFDTATSGSPVRIGTNALLELRMPWRLAISDLVVGHAEFALLILLSHNPEPRPFLADSLPLGL